MLNSNDIVNRVSYANDRVVVKKYNRDSVVIISVDEYEKLLDPTKRLSQSEWQASVQRLDKIRAKMPKVDPEELEREIDLAVKEVRAEKKAKGG